MSNLIQIFGPVFISICLSTHFSIAWATGHAINPNMQTVSSPRSHAPLSSSSAALMSSLASKVIFQSPAMENIYKEFLVASKPLTLRKYNVNGKIKKTRKESKIYYIPMPPMPYRYVPGVGYDYQPMRISPILHESPKADQLANAAKKGVRPQQQQQNPYGYGHIQQQHVNMSNNKNQNSNKSKNKYQQDVKGSDGLTAANSSTSSFATSNINSNAIDESESKLIRIDRGDYFFNGRPFRLQAAHARNQNTLTPQNLKSMLYFNKKIIY